MKCNQLYLVIASLLWMSPFRASAADEPDPVIVVTPVPQVPAAIPASSEVLTGKVFESSGIPVSQARSKAPIKLADGINLFADAAVGVGYDSNVTMAQKGQEVGSQVLNLRPTLVAEAKYRSDVYTLAYKGDYTRYPNFDSNKLDNNDFLFNATNVFDSRASVFWGLAHQDRYEPIGSTDRSVGSAVPDHYSAQSANATFRYGADEATGRIEVDAGMAHKEYLNNRASTASADVDTSNYAARFYYRVASKTRVLTELRRTTFDYVQDINFLENTDVRAYLGITLDSGSALSGTLKAGQQSKNFAHDQIRPKYEGFSWEAAIRWKPRSYSTFDLVGGRAAVDPTGTTDIPVVKGATLSWTHDWASFVHSRVSGGRSSTLYRQTGRHDSEDIYSAGLTYDVRRWLGLSVEYMFSHRDSNMNNNDYIRRLTMLKLDASF